MFLVHNFNDIHYFCKNKVCIKFLLLFFVLFLFIRSMLILIVFKVTHSLYFRRCMIKKCMHVMPSFHVRDSCCFSQMYVGYMEKVQVPLRETNAIYLVLAMISTCKRLFCTISCQNYSLIWKSFPLSHVPVSVKLNSLVIIKYYVLQCNLRQLKLQFNRS